MLNLLERFFERIRNQPEDAASRRNSGDMADSLGN
jgi:hypothetical protein